MPFTICIQMSTRKIPASIQLADLEGIAQWRERTFCEERLADNAAGRGGGWAVWPRDPAVRWLIEEFKRPKADDQLGMRIWGFAMPAVADDLIGLIRTRKYGEERGPICLALAKTR